MERFVVGVAKTVRGGRHAVKQPKNLQLGFELVGHAVDDQIGVADGILNGRNKVDGGQRLGAEGAKSISSRIDSRAWWRLPGITSSMVTR